MSLATVEILEVVECEDTDSKKSVVHGGIPVRWTLGDGDRDLGPRRLEGSLSRMPMKRLLKAFNAFFIPLLAASQPRL